MLARDSETGEDAVVYQAMYPPFYIWVRPLALFLGELTPEQALESNQKFRFVKTVPDEQAAAFSGVSERGESAGGSNREGGAGTAAERETKGAENLSLGAGTDLKEIYLSGQPGKYLSSRMAPEEIAQRGLMELLDAGTYREKRQIYTGLRQYLDKRLLSNIAVALDIVLEEGSLEEQYETILRCMETFEKYEVGGRLRR